MSVWSSWPRKKLQRTQFLCVNGPRPIAINGDEEIPEPSRERNQMRECEVSLGDVLRVCARGWGAGAAVNRETSTIALVRLFSWSRRSEERTYGRSAWGSAISTTRGSTITTSRRPTITPSRWRAITSMWRRWGSSVLLQHQIGVSLKFATTRSPSHTP